MPDRQHHIVIGISGLASDVRRPTDEPHIATSSLIRSNEPKKTAPKERLLFACSAQAVPEAGPLLWVARLWQWCIFRASCVRPTGDAILALRSYAEVILPCLFAPANQSTKCEFSFPARRCVVWPGSGFILRSKKRQGGEGACLIVVPRLWASLFNKVVHRICGKE